MLLVARAFDIISRMHSSVVSLCDDQFQLKAEVIQLRNAVEEKEQALTEKTQRIEQLLDYILLLHKRQFGASADRTNKDQVSLFDEAELEQLLAKLDLHSQKPVSSASNSISSRLFWSRMR
jgi:SMC interacting uncharacterized protein involved in chromosome segregation